MIAYPTMNSQLLGLKNFNFANPIAKPPKSPKKAPNPRPRLAAFQKARLRARVSMVTCSEPWTEVAVERAEAQAIDPMIANVERQLADRGIYPPRPDLGPNRLPRAGAVLMRRCDGCGRVVPPNNVASYRLVQLCDDCRIEPDVDRNDAADQPANRPHGARAPGAQFGTLMEGIVDAGANRKEAREQLIQIGLTEAEIMAMSFTHAGYSTRRVAELGRWSQTYVRKLLKSAASKLRRSGLVVPQPRNVEVSCRSRSVDPVKLDGMTQRLADRPHCEEL
jgi:hypothetical protein